MRSATTRFGNIGRVLLAIVIAPILVGCHGSTKQDAIWIYRYPTFFKDDLKRIAVLRFGNRTRVRGVGERISDKVSAVLTNNRTYEVYTRTNLKDILREQDASNVGIISGDLAKKIGRLKSVQALVCGVCNRCETTTKSETRYNAVPIWGKNAQGMPVVTGYRQVPYRYTRHDAFVECQMVVIDCVTGLQIYAVSEPSNLYAAGSPPKYGPADLLRMAEDDQINRLVRGVAVTRTQIKLEGEVLQTATSLYEGKWEYQRRLTPPDKQFYVVVRLPAAADRNNFQITIVPKGERETVAQKPFVWTRRHGSFGHKFLIDPIVKKQGFGDYQAKLYSGPVASTPPIATYDFSIVEKR
ncbi:MAG: hypothetical protein JXQ73_30395 [Phycisphaerae bacterium]|nr:hypothetical protein [Phycisphaerae bacterium]